MVNDPGADLSMLELFFAELDTHSHTLVSGLVDSCAGADAKQLVALMRAAHSLRGAARIVGLPTPAVLTGAMEKLLSAGGLTTGDLARLRDAAALLRRLAAGGVAGLAQAIQAEAAEMDRLAEQLTSPQPAPPPPAPASRAVDPFLLDLFRTELENNSRVLEAGLVETEACRDPKKIEPLMRASHSLKGAARIIGLDLAVRLAHAMEDVLSAAQQGKRELNDSDFERLLRANDVFAGLTKCAPQDIPSALDAHAGLVDELVREFAKPPAPAIDPSLLDLFRTELENNSRVLEAGLVETEACRDPKKIEPLMRASHSLKGAARIIGLDLAVRLAHAMEDVLSAAQHGKRELSSSDFDRLLRANDIFACLAKCAPQEIPAALDEHAGLVDELVREFAKPPAPAIDSSLLDLFRTELENNSRVLEAGLVETEACRDPKKIEPLMRASHSLKGAARIIGLDLAVRLAHAMEDVLSAAQQGKRQLAESDFDLLLRANDVFLGLAKCAPQEIPAALNTQAAHVDALIRQFAAPAKQAPVESVPKPAAPAAPKVEEASVRISVENLNRLTGFAGECLVEVKTLAPLTRTLQRIKQHHTMLSNAIEQAMEALREESPAKAQARLEEAVQQTGWIHRAIPGHLSEFERFSRKLEHLVNRLYDEAVASRMRPFADGLHGFPRMVRDLAKSLSKSVQLVIEGEATRVDRDILEKLEAPLTHLLRNAIDHGLEPPAVRVAAGKPEEGTVRLAARHVAGVLEIVVEDSGAGIDTERVRQQVVSRGYVGADMATKLSDAEVLDFLFLPGFSTRKGVTEISGRGVGLDVVQSMVRQVGGSVRVESRLGVGTRFVMQLPLTLSVIRTLMFEVKGQPYALPLTRVDRVLSVPPEEIRVLEERQYCRMGDQNIGLVDAGQILDEVATSRPPGDIRVVVLSDRLNRYGLVVDRLIGEHDLVVVPLPSRLGKVPNVSAGAILEDGSPIAILDSEDLVRSIDNLLTQGSLLKLDKSGKEARSGRKRVLVVDDSLTVREVERRLLENRGYDVTVAVDGMDGWNAVQNSRFDLVLTDIDMPRMDGIELVRRIKSAPHTSSIPVIIVSYKDQEEYRLLGLEAGAECYLTKSSFHDETLVDTVHDLIEGGGH